MVPILDPGVKNEKGYSVRDDGLRHKAFCLTPEGKPYTGFVWPSDSLFPDFSREDASRWWAAWVRRFAEHGIHGAWLDMNDPSVGPVECDNMLFNAGDEKHDSYHNQYALGMARASHAGFLAAHPDRRPFLISRSGFTGIQKYAAIWTGDNLSSDTYLKGSIPCSLNLALSGIPFNGPDVPGFARDATAELMVRWHKAGFLFPFLRNHCCRGNRHQEPWAFGARVRRIVAHLIRLRYKLMPYLYNLFIEHEDTGEAVMRPCFYDFPGDAGLDRLDDQFLLGPALLHAPVVEPDGDRRKVLLPQADWFDLGAGRWRNGGRTVIANQTAGGHAALRSGRQPGAHDAGPAYGQSHRSYGHRTALLPQTRRHRHVPLPLRRRRELRLPAGRAQRRHPCSHGDARSAGSLRQRSRSRLEADPPPPGSLRQAGRGSNRWHCLPWRTRHETSGVDLHRRQAGLRQERSHRHRIMWCGSHTMR